MDRCIRKEGFDEKGDDGDTVNPIAARLTGPTEADSHNCDTDPVLMDWLEEDSVLGNAMKNNHEYVMSQ